MLGERCLVKSLVVIPQQYNIIAALLVCKSVEMFLDTSSGSHCKERFIMPLNKARRFGKYNRGKQSEQETHGRANENCISYFSCLDEDKAIYNLKLSTYVGCRLSLIFK